MNKVKKIYIYIKIKKIGGKTNLGLKMYLVYAPIGKICQFCTEYKPLVLVLDQDWTILMISIT